MSSKSGFVSIIGRPNAGKSTLLNLLVNEKISIVSPKAQTTRREIRGIVKYDDVQAIYVDTPGLCHSNSHLEKILYKNLKNAVRDSDVTIILIDATEKLSEINFFNNKYFDQKPVAVALNKTDLVKHKEQLLEMAAEISKKPYISEIFMISALNNEGIEPLKNFVKKSLPDGPYLYPDDFLGNTDLDLKFRLAEITREKIFENLNQELPYSIYVVTDKLQITEKKFKIIQTIVAIKDSQKGIILGHKGNMIRKIKISAIQEMKAIFNKNIDLKLFVRIRENWTQNKEQLISAGII